MDVLEFFEVFAENAISIIYFDEIALPKVDWSLHRRIVDSSNR